MLGMIANLPAPLLWLSVLSLLLVAAALVDRVVTTLVAGPWRKAVRGVLPTVGLPVMLLGVFAAAHLAYDGAAANRAAADAAVTEARLLRETVSFARAFDAPVRNAVLTGLRGYTERSIDKERAEMRHGTANPASGGGLLAILDAAMAYAPTAPGQRLAQAEVITRLKAIGDIRRERLAVASQPLDTERWAVVLFLTVLTLFTAALSHSEFPGGRRLALAIHALTFGSLLAIAAGHAAPYGHAGLEPLGPLAAILPLLQ